MKKNALFLLSLAALGLVGLDARLVVRAEPLQTLLPILLEKVMLMASVLLMLFMATI